jgi:hypothetical protein
MLVLAVLAGISAGSAAGEMYKCGKTIQDRPCESLEVQQRFSRTQGTFAIEQVNPTTDADCARMSGQAIVLWRRMAQGEPLGKLQTEVQEQKISRYEKSVLRDVLVALKNTTGSERDVRSQFETQCMAYKRRNGYATERDARVVTRDDASTESARQSLRQAQMDAQRAEIDARRAEMEARRADAQARAAAARAARNQQP